MSRRFDHLGDVETFVTVVEKGSMTTAAVALATTPSVLSRAITRLEARLGVQLLRRTTRRLSLTEQGRLYLEQARAAFALIDDAERTIQGQGDELKGSVRLSAPTTYAHHRLPGLMQRFSAQHPQVRIELNIANRNVDLVAEGYDLAIRMGSLPDSGLVARKLEDAAMCLIAAPSYIARAGAPADIGDLARHRCLAFVMPSTGRVSPWILRADGRDIDWVPQGGLQVSDDVLGVVTLAQSGLGICQTYDFIAQDLIAQGRAVEVLTQARGRSRPFSVIYAPHRRLSSASRALIDSFVATVSE
ncbi:DNA-binding transcriptional LysR family regulator [Variovorax sp. SG517]|uniref:LysR family transcriptional regulator n=1 Tax=Variovorax sp. SG517 TaxID=2587117 RepID=UPI00159DEFDE|nr:LysR family transcriptional regulator [Variovorax sp. SG517]NVM90551.1 DNA-binding transcriptional LysR family regulator [Variovorax sp. SG517]